MRADLPVARPEMLGLSAARLARIPDFFEERYVRPGKLVGFSTLVARRGEVAHVACRGLRDRERGLPIEPDTVFRIYSMTKPVTSVALMMLYEEGRFQLDHPVGRWLPELADLRVYESGEPGAFVTRAADRPITIRDLLTHTSGLTYSFMYSHPVDAAYRAAGIDAGFSDRFDLAETLARLAEMPLLFSPGTRWSYSIATDVCGRLIEVLTGESLDAVLRTRIFAPLGMVDTGFTVGPEARGRFAACYEKNLRTRAVDLMDPSDASIFARPRRFLSGGGGLVSTLADYLRFCRMLLDGGALDGVRLLSRKTVALMAANHLPGNRTLREVGLGAFTEQGFDGAGFGLGLSVLLDPIAAGLPASAGSYSWGGLASTDFWIDPAEELIAILMTQLVPSRTYPLRPQFRQLVYAAFDD